ncbi:MAG: FimB/Mfa2 family fimbrial subunit [Culturomica sp.]|nr:FimB/Mfa2 family fimbrial subunit [Culturomica sp.]
MLPIIFANCRHDNATSDVEADKAMLALSLRTSNSSVNVDFVKWEDRVTEVRMIAFASDGNVVFNELLSFPNGFNNPSDVVEMAPETYDFYFIANETACGSKFAEALANTRDKIQFKTSSDLYGIAYNADFMPDGSSSDGRFLMSAQYENIEVNGGGSAVSPITLPLPTQKVELIRSMAKVEVIFRKKTAGGVVANGTIKTVQLNNVASLYSVPPTDFYYAGSTMSSNIITPVNFDYGRDSIGSIVFYVPEFLRLNGGGDFTGLYINDKVFPILTDKAKTGLQVQRREIDALSDSSVIRNYHYQINAYINAKGDIQLKICINPWNVDTYRFMFQDPEMDIDIPPVQRTDSSVIIPTDCGKIEIISHNEDLPKGLQGAYGDQVSWWDPVTQKPRVIRGEAPYYCEKKYGKGWRLINACELMSFLALFDRTYKIWQSNTWQGVNSGLTFHSLPFRKEAQALLEKMTGTDLSRYVLSDDGKDDIGAEKLNMLDDFFTPGDIMVKEEDYPDGWPFPSPPAVTDKWFYQEVALQVKGYYYNGYLDYNDPANHDKILYEEFARYDFSPTISRCVREVE